MTKMMWTMALKEVMMMDKTEIRDLMTNKIEIREDDDGNRTISGYAVKWEMKSQVLGMFFKFREQIKKGAFLESLNNDDQRFLWSHDTAKVLGRTKNNKIGRASCRERVKISEGTEAVKKKKKNR